MATERTATPELTIDELARRAGTTTRNIRAYQTRGLLPPPRIVGRVGRYDQRHVAHLEVIARLQERGFSLAAIAEVLRAWREGASLGDLLRFEETLTAPWSDEAEETITPAQLGRLFPEAGDDPELLRRAIELELVVPDGTGFRVPTPSLLRIGAQLVAAGIPARAALDQFEQLRSDTERIAARFVELFARYVWKPSAVAGMGPERLAEVTDILARLRPMAAAAVSAALAQAMEREVPSATADRPGGTEGPPPSSPA